VSFVVEGTESYPLSRQEIFDIMHPQGVRMVGVGPSGIGESEEVASLKLELLASDGKEARERAENLLYQARRAAGLPDRTATVAWVTPLSDEDSSSARFLDKAEELLDDEDEADMAVVAAQIHLETQVRILLSRAVEADKGPQWVDVIMGTRGLGNLNSQKVQALIRALLGIDVTEAPEWEAYEAHNVLRNAIVHEGQDALQHEAKESVEMVRQLSIRLANAALERAASN
jgi:hypothetical protein